MIKKDIRCKDDEMTHLYTLIVKPDNTYEVLIDNEKVESGNLESDWDFLPAKKIDDPNAKKPEDWEDKEKIDDPNDKKPDDWEKPKHIPDPKAKKPDDWDDEMDGEWEPPMVDNPEYKVGLFCLLCSSRKTFTYNFFFSRANGNRSKSTILNTRAHGCILRSIILNTNPTLTCICMKTSVVLPSTCGK